jgi:hypothetical protein
MKISVTPVVSAAVEGDLDEAVLDRVLAHVGGVLGPVHGRSGKGTLRRNIVGYNQAARFSAWVVLVDLDQDASCAPDLRTAWLPSPSRLMCFRVAVHEVESWLLGDRERLAALLGVSVSSVPLDPDEVLNPKALVVDLARRSRRRDVRVDMVPRSGSHRAVGPAYSSRLIEFVSGDHWRPEVAETRSDSLARCMRSLRDLIARA